MSEFSNEVMTKCRLFTCKVQSEKKQIKFQVITRNMKRAIRAAELRAVRHLDSYTRDLRKNDDGTVGTVKTPDATPFQLIIEREY
jgi:hypothetical protein